MWLHYSADSKDCASISETIGKHPDASRSVLQGGPFLFWDCLRFSGTLSSWLHCGLPPAALAARRTAENAGEAAAEAAAENAGEAAAEAAAENAGEAAAEAAAENAEEAAAEAAAALRRSCARVLSGFPADVFRRTAAFCLHLSEQTNQETVKTEKVKFRLTETL
ncbi:unnamed protein product [[Candida] boidinii]|uniref:Unnamed protein product n=1 Tax=Candida boidinii TaxID=5477 RepID=A0ACB5TVY7_CANBO|nr:unnamed protein product [[Candida] boidinii]